MLPYRDSRVIKIALVVFFLLVAGYAYFEARGILFGPSIQVSQAIQTVSDPYIEITGTTSHIASLQVNGNDVPVTEAGAFDIPYVLIPGDNRIVLDAKDKYGKSTERILQIVYVPAATSSESTASSTAATSSSATSTAASSSAATSTR